VRRRGAGHLRPASAVFVPMKTALVLFNLGGPDRPEAVAPFLFNLFNDPAIIGLPNPLRWVLAKLLSSRRTPKAKEIYARIGGGSPLLPNTEAQGAALEAALGDGYKAFIVMRYWHPMSAVQVRAVQAWKPDRVILLPLYPQFSTTTTGSSLTDWQRAAAAVGLDVPAKALCCYPTDAGFIAAVAGLVRQALDGAVGAAKPRVLFTAHGLPKKIVTKGDPYQWQVEQTVGRVVERLAVAELDWIICYQSRVGPLEWIGPSTDQEILRAGRDRVPVILVPIAFVSEHSETLVELDIEYRELAQHARVPGFHRVPTVGSVPDFIDGLAHLVRGLEVASVTPCSGEGGRICPGEFTRCPFGDPAVTA
jgi:protoporphyrin/coproporphyrin ferrochelatase